MMQHFSQNGFVVPMDEEEGNLRRMQSCAKSLRISQLSKLSSGTGSSQERSPVLKATI